jgi:hypothetical protein
VPSPRVSENENWPDAFVAVDATGAQKFHGSAPRCQTSTLANAIGCNARHEDGDPVWQVGEVVSR